MQSTGQAQNFDGSTPVMGSLIPRPLSQLFACKIKSWERGPGDEAKSWVEVQVLATTVCSGYNNTLEEAKLRA